MNARRQRPERTLVDWLGTSISPILIMVMVGSFIHFLLGLAYGGPYLGRLRWTMTWFVFAMVLISRISMEESFGKASVYGVLLAWATSMWIFRFVDFVFGVLVFLGFIWWCAAKLVWDCSMTEEDEDASGEGLLGAVGLGGADEAEKKARVALVPWWERLLRNRSERPGMPPAPGLWVVYFSLVALPVFGFGYALLPSSDSAQRNACFVYLWTYALSALGLLMLSSFLNLRRYLRQRYLAMPGALVWNWLRSGTWMVVLVVFGSMVLPRPEGAYRVSGLLHAIKSPAEPSEEEPKEESGDTDGKNGTGGQKESEGKGEDGQSKPKSGQVHQGQPSQSGVTGKTTAAPKSDGSKPWRLLVFAILVVGGGYLLVRYGKVILAFLRSIWDDFRGSVKSAVGSREAEAGKGKAPRKFASWRNPFAGGGAERMDRGKLLIDTFSALEAWAREQGMPRGTHQTPIEFADSLAVRFFNVRSPLEETARAYSNLAYGAEPPSEEILPALETLWATMSTRVAGLEGR